jgi:hypothetical protein
VVLLAEQVLSGDLGLVEGDGRGVGGSLSELVLLLVDRDRVVLRYDERGDAAMAGVLVRLGVDREPVRIAAVGDEALGAVDDVLVALLDGAGLHPGDVGAGVRLGQAEGGELGGLGEHPEVLLLDLLGAADANGRGGEAVGHQRGADARAAPAHLLLDQAA